MTKNVKRNRKDKNLSGLYVISNDIAYKNGKLRDGVYGAVSKDTPYVCKPANSQKGKPRTFVRDSTDLAKVCKNRILAFWDDKNNRGKTVCYLAEKPLYEEMVGKTTQKTTKQGSSKGKNSARKPGTTSYKTSTSKKVTSRDNNSLW